MTCILVGTTKAYGIPQGLDMGEDIGIQVSPQEVDVDINSNVDPTSLAIQVPIFGTIPKKVPISPRFVAYAHKGVGGAPNKKLKTFTQSSINGAIIIAFTLGKSSKIELLKMEANKEITLKMIELDHNVERQLQLA
jgi:hypothetical protein